MSMKWTILILLISFGLGSCRSASGRDTQLLTNSPWIYEKAAFNTDDDEEAAQFDALDPRIMGFVKDYTVIFKIDGTGTLRESNAKGKNHRIDSFPFLWSFQKNDSLLYFQDQYYRVQTLTNDHLIIYADHKLKGVNSRYTIVLKH
jgi:hypothetical protein